MCLIYLVQDHRSVLYKLPDGVYVVVRDEQQIFWTWTQEDLIFERHDHQFIKLQEEKRKKILIQLQNNKQTINTLGFKLYIPCPCWLGSAS